MRLFIDGQVADIQQSEKVEVTIDALALTLMDQKEVAQSNEFEIPMTTQNRKIMGWGDQINDATQFNKVQHSARIEVDGAEIIAGDLLLVKCKATQKSQTYIVKIVGSRNTWVQQSAKTPLKQTQIVYDQVISPSLILQSWQGQQTVRFLPVQRDTKMVENAAENLVLPTKMLSTEDYHPFIHLKTLVKQIFDSAGYKIVSQFFESELFKSLYMSGMYSEKNVDNLKDKMDFLAGKFNDTMGTASAAGRVFADNNTASATSLGFLVDSADPKEMNNGNTIPELFNNNNCFRKTETNIQFVPTQEVTVAFEYDLKYYAEYIITSRTDLKGFDTIQLHDLEQRKFRLINRFVDRQAEVKAGYQYMVIVFNYLQGYVHRVVYDVLTNPNADLNNLQSADYTTTSAYNFTTRCGKFTINTTYPILRVRLLYKTTSALLYQTYPGDWAIYDASVEERGRMNVEAKFRSMPQKVTPGSPVSFINVFFGGAENTFRLTLSKNSRIRPIFMEYPGLGSRIKFEDIAAHQVSQLQLIKAVAQMFNLAFYSDNKNKEVYIEPKNVLIGQEQIIDWSQDIDLQKPVEVIQVGEQEDQKIELEYATGDGAVTRWNQENRQKLGAHTYLIENNFAKPQTKQIKNGIFTASINCDQAYPDAPEAQIIQVGERVKNQRNDSQEVNFPTKIVSYVGLTPLPKPQIWGWPSYGNQYPMAVFHHKNTSLCFEDRDGQTGLHTYYDSQIEAINQGRMVAVYIKITPIQIEAILNPNRLKQDFRARFKLKINGETALFNLDKICGYNPKQESTMCLFTKII